MNPTRNRKDMATNIMTCDNDCTVNGWTEYMATSAWVELHVSVAPGSDVWSEGLEAFCHDTQKMIFVNGWMLTWEEA